eukprot:Polyplicarium_translucidae@DN1710_c1_g1_i1.p1
MTIALEKAEYDGMKNELRFSGKTVSENSSVQKDVFHTLKVGLNNEVSISKGYWDTAHISRLKLALDPRKAAEVSVVLIDSGVANLFAVTDTLVKHLAKVTVPVPKRQRHQDHEKTTNKFFETVFASILQNVDFATMKCVVIGGPGFVKEAFLAWMYQAAEKRGIASILKSRESFFTAKANSAFKQSLDECLADPAVQHRVASTRTSSQAAALEELYRRLQCDPLRACCGRREVLLAAERGAVHTLLITEGLLRAADGIRRKRFVALAESVSRTGGKVVMFSDQHVSGEQLGALGGLAALLKFRLSELEEISESEDDHGVENDAE